MYRCICWHSNQAISPWKMDKSVVDQPSTHPGSRQMQLLPVLRARYTAKERFNPTRGGSVAAGRHQPKRGEEKSKCNLHGPDLRDRQKTPPRPCPYIEIIGMWAREILS